jgi:hypothetical protein
MSHKNTLKSLLRDGKVVFVRFKKVNGDIRHMICTTNAEFIPSRDRPRGKMEYSENQIRVFDLVAKGWRSMVVKNIMEVEEYTAEVA